MKPILKTKNKSIQLKEVHDTLRLIQEQDLDFVGKKYLKRANQNILQHNFRAAYKNIFLGFENIVCDCGIGGWLLRDLKKSLLKSKTFNCNIYQLNLIQAYIHWISREYESALNFINSFIHYKNDDEIGFYLKGRIYEGMNEFEKAIENYNISLSLKKTSKTLYRIGRIKEEHLNENGISELYQASLSNVISHCCGRLAEYAVKRGIILPEPNSFFVHCFNKGGVLLFTFAPLYTPTIIKLENGNELNYLEEKSKLLKSLVKNKKLFLTKSNIESHPF